MRRLYALLLLALTIGIGLSEAQAQTYTLQNYLVRSIPPDFQDISSFGTDVTPAIVTGSIYDFYQRVSPNEYTIPFNFRWINTITNKFKVTGSGHVVIGGNTEMPAGIQYWTMYNVPSYNYGYYSGTSFYGAPNNLLSAWGPLGYSNADTKYHYAVVGSAPNRVLIVQTSRAQDYGGTSVMSWQIRIYESGISRVEYAYRTDIVGDGYWRNLSTPNYGAFVGATGKSFTISTSTQYRTANDIMCIYTRPAPIGTPSVYYTTTPQTYTQFNLPLPVNGYRIFIASPYDLAAKAITAPLLDQILNKDVPRAMTGVIANEGSSTPTAATINRRVSLLGVGQVYNETMNITPPAAFASTNVTFPNFTPLAYGIYYDTMEVISTSPADQGAANNVTSTSYVVSPANNIKGIAITNPAAESRTPINIATPVGATFRNLGSNNQINVPVSMVIYDPSGEVVYRDTVRFPTFATGTFRDTSFRDWTPTVHGRYRFCAIGILPSDELRADDTACSEALVAYENDLAATVIINPEPDEEKPEKKVFKVFAKFQSVGVADLFDIPARLQIRRCSDNGLVFQADSIIQAVNVDQGQVTFGFPTRQGAYDVTKLAPGCYNACVIARYPTDGDRTNDTACTTFSIIPRLQGNIEVGKGKRFRTISAAVDSMRFRGIGGHLNLILTDTYYRDNGNSSVSTNDAALNFEGIEGTAEIAKVTWMPKRGVSPRIAIYGNKPHSFYFGPGRRS